MSIHVTDIPLAGQVEGAFRRGATQGLIVAGDLTSAADAKTAVDDANALKHVADKPLAFPLKDAIDKVDNVLGAGLAAGGSLANIYAAGPGGDWNDIGPVM